MEEETELEIRAKKAGLPAKMIALLTPLTLLLGIKGLPAFGVGLLAAMASSIEGSRKMREIDRLVQTEVGMVEAEVHALADDVADAKGRAEEVRQRVKELERGLTDAQIEQIGRLFEDYMATLDAKRIELLKNAVQCVARGVGDDFDRQMVVVGLRNLGTHHIEELHRYYMRYAVGDQSAAIRGADLRRAMELHVGLEAASFMKSEIDVDLEKVSGTSGSGIVNNTRARKSTSQRITNVGIHALIMLYGEKLPSPKERSRYYKIYQAQKHG